MELTVSCAAMWGGKSRLNGLSSSGRGWNNRSLFLALMVMSGAPARAQSGSEVPVVVVSSLEQLRAATDASAPHIVLQSHLALTSLPPQDAGEWLFPLQGVKSIRVRASLSFAPVWSLATSEVQSQPAKGSAQPQGLRLHPLNQISLRSNQCARMSRAFV